MKLSVVLTHPIQYYSPWFRYISARSNLDLEVIYAVQPNADQQGVGFGVPFAWDGFLTQGYKCRIVAPHSLSSVNLSSDKLFGVLGLSIGNAIINVRPDVVLLPGWHSIVYLVALFYCRVHGIPVLLRGDTNMGNRPAGLRGIVWHARTKILLKQFSSYLAVGTKARKYLNYFGIPSQQIVSCPHCVDNDYFVEQSTIHATVQGRRETRKLFGLNSAEFVLLFVGKLEHKKRPQDVLRAAALLGSAVAVLIIGDGELRGSLSELANRLGVNTVFTGFRNQSELARIYSCADCLVLPSDSGETWGLVVNEAMASGIPCIVSDRVGCTPDLIEEGDTGEVFHMGDIQDLSAAISRVRSRTAQGHDWSRACRNKMIAFSFETATLGLISACRQVKKT